MALRGEVVPPAVIGDTASEDVPPVPPLPAGVALQKNIAVENALAFKSNSHHKVLPEADTVVALPVSTSARDYPHPANPDGGDRRMDSSAGGDGGSFKGSSNFAASTKGGGSLRLPKKKRGVDVEKILGSIDAVAGGGGGGGGPARR
ncbi:MAG: hypothetical protein Q9206_007443, partial [Seirophora lacunosa]